MSLFDRARNLLFPKQEPTQVVRQPGVEPGLRLPPPRELPVRLVEKRLIARDTMWVAFEAVDTPLFPWVAGQHATLIFDADDTRNLRRETRIYSIWNHPAGATRVEVILKLMPAGRASDTFRAVEPGAEFPMVGPQGTFSLRTPLAQRQIFVATGTGFAPICAMLQDLGLRGELEQREVVVLWGLRSQADQFGHAELDALVARWPRLRVVTTLTRPTEGWQGAVGRVTDHLEALAPNPKDTQVYVCGNGQMILDVFARLERRGLKRESGHVVFEKFFDAPYGGITGLGTR